MGVYNAITIPALQVSSPGRLRRGIEILKILHVYFLKEYLTSKTEENRNYELSKMPDLKHLGRK